MGSGIPAQEPVTALAKASSSTSAAPTQTRERKRKTAVSPPASVRARKDSQTSPSTLHQPLKAPQPDGAPDHGLLLEELIRQTQLLQRQQVDQQDIVFRLQSRVDSLEIEL